MSRNLVYFTNGFPGDIYSEKVFVEQELDALRKHFDNIVIVPLDNEPRTAGYESQLPAGVTADWTIAEDRTVHSKLLKLLCGVAHPFVAWSLRMMVGEAKTPLQWRAGLYQALNIVVTARLIRRILDRHGFRPDNTVLLSLWFHNVAAATALLAEREGWKVAVHAHTSDIYDERMAFRSRRVRSRLLRSIGLVLPISQHGLDYFKRRFPEHTDKFVLGRLGSRRLFQPHMESVAGDNRAAINLVTIARISPEKRHEMILDVLSEVAAALPDRRIRWTVIGDGPLLEPLRRKVYDSHQDNLEICLMGKLSNDEIQCWLSESRPDWLIMLSSTEGMPVSMGEAMSYGVPVITTDVGQIRELVDEESALLMPGDLTAGEYAARIIPVLCDAARRHRMSHAALSQWEHHFNSAVFSEQNAARIASLLPES